MKDNYDFSIGEKGKFYNRDAIFMPSEPTFSDVLWLFGKASFYASQLEEQLSSICTLSEAVTNPNWSTLTIDEKKILVAKLEKMTLGQLLRELKRHAKASPDLDSKLNAIFSVGIEKRNDLSHRFFINHKESLLLPSGLVAALKELNEIIDDVKLAALRARDMSSDLQDIF
jgi:hypothetical protein